MNVHERRGFTLIELLIVVVIVAILAAIAWGRFNRPRLAVVVAPDSVVAPQSAGRFMVQVENSFGRPQRGVPVVFRVVEGTATITPEVVQTDSTGSAAAQWVAGTEAGLNAFSARVGDSNWSGAETTIALRVDPAMRSSPPSAAPGTPGADSAAQRRDTTVPTAAPRTPAPASDTVRRDTTGVPPSDDGPREDHGADSAATKFLWGSAPLWARLLVRERSGFGED